MRCVIVVFHSDTEQQTIVSNRGAVVACMTLAVYAGIYREQGLWTGEL